MKLSKIANRLFAGFYTIILIILCACTPTNKMYNLGTPAKKYYNENLVARCIWDMEIYDNRLYVGCGDYISNSGPTPVIYCDLDTLGEWKTQAVLLDEQIGKFLIVDNKLTIPGLDPIGSPEVGTYYRLENNNWKTYFGLLDGQHNFDLIRYNGILFAGIGADRGETPIIASQNDKAFIRMPMYKDGKLISTLGGEVIRTHNFFIINDKLYADFWYENLVEGKLISEIYRLENNSFVFDNEWASKLNGLNCKNLPPVYSKAIIDNTLFFTTGYLYSSKDMSTIEMLQLPKKEVVYDIYVVSDKLYVLAAAKKNEKYKITIYSNSTGENIDFEEEFTFYHELPPTSFAVDVKNYYLSVGNWDAGFENNGTVFCIERSTWND